MYASLSPSLGPEPPFNLFSSLCLVYAWFKPVLGEREASLGGRRRATLVYILPYHPGYMYTTRVCTPLYSPGYTSCIPLVSIRTAVHAGP